MDIHLDMPDPLPSAYDSAETSWRMFDRIAGRYDLLNRLLSFRQDVGWRKFLCRRALERPDARVLDLATGTADVLLALSGYGDRLKSGVGLDMSFNMLRLGKAKIGNRGLERRLRLMRGDAANIAARPGSFDAVTIAFGIRNVPDVPRALREMNRVLTSSGRALVLEFSLPANRLFRGLYLFYFRHVLPFVGGLVSGDRAAYRYLNRTVEDFPYGEAFSALMRDAGFTDVRAFPLTMGIATLYEGTKPA